LHRYIGVVVYLCLAVVAAPAVSQEPFQSPNIVFILADDLGYGDVGVYNAESKIPTPNIDTLAEQGMRFTDAHTPSSVCTPTRYAFLTGRYCWRTELKHSVLWPWDPPLLEDERVTLPEMLRATRAQYATACIGKWHLGWVWASKDDQPVVERIGALKNRANRAKVAARVDFTQPVKGGPITHGFDSYFGDDVPNFPPYTFFENDRLLEQPTQMKPNTMFGDPGPMAPGWELANVMPAITDRAVAYIESREQRGEPFFLYMPLTAPHTPIVPAEQYQGKSDAGRYGDFVHQVDATVGAVLQALDDADLADNTIVIFTSDNGSPARSGENDNGATHSVTRQTGHVPNAPWRGLKSDIWEAGHRVPHVVRWPGVVEPGTTSDQLVCLVDWYATLADLHHMPILDDQAEDSFSLLPILKGVDQPVRTSLVHHSGNGTFAIRVGDWKLIENNLGSGGFSRPGRVKPNPDGPQGQLYNLNADPKETTNRWLEEPEKVEMLQAELDKIRDSGRSR